MIRERLFGPDTVEEALKVVDNVSLGEPNKARFRVLTGINDMEFNLICTSMNARRRSEGRFMSPIIAMCTQNAIPVGRIGRNLDITSSRLSQICMRQPYEFYSLLWLLATKRITVLRTPQAKPFLMQRIPRISSVIIDEGSTYMGAKILQATKAHEHQKIVAVVPMEQFAGVLEFLSQSDSVDVEKLITTLEVERMGVWIPVVLIYIVLPLTILWMGVTRMFDTKVVDLSNYETQGVALGTWVRDKRRD